MSIELVTLIMFGGLMVCLMAGIPIAFSMAVIGIGITTMLWGSEGPKILPLKIRGWLSPETPLPTVIK